MTPLTWGIEVVTFRARKQVETAIGKGILLTDGWKPGRIRKELLDHSDLLKLFYSPQHTLYEGHEEGYQAAALHR